MKIFITKNTWLANSDLRLDASYHLSDGQLTIIAFKKAKISTVPLNKVTKRIFYGGRSKRAYVNNLENGLPFIKGADIIKADFSNLKIISRKRTANLNEYFLEEGWSLITRSGTIGNTAYVNKDFIGKAASDDIIRIVPSNIPSGFLYAFLSSKNGKALLTHGTYGAVIQHIEPEHIENIPIPIFPLEKQLKIHELVTESAHLRVDANLLLKDAVMKFENTLPKVQSNKVYVSSFHEIAKNNLRIDASTNYLNIQSFYQSISQKYKLVTVSELAETVFTPGIFKRIRVLNPNSGIPFLSGSDLLNAFPSFDSFLSKKMKNIDDYILRQDWIAIQDAGTIGYVSLINGYLDGVAATNNLVRIIPKKDANNKNMEGYSNFGDNNTNKVISQMKTNPQYKVSSNQPITSDNDPEYPYYPYPDMMENVNRFRKQERLDTFPTVEQSPPYFTPYDNNNKLLMEKLNYMIHLLEESHDEPTNNVLEEVILYSFLGIFIIFLIDNFIKVGRYVR